MGLSQIRLEPNLIAAEDDPTARLTIGKDITKNLDLIYSMDLLDSGDQIWIAEYELTRRFLTKAVKQQDNSFRFEFRHDLEFGARGVDYFAGIKPPPRRNIENIEFAGTFYFPEQKLRDVFRLEPGDRYNFFKIRNNLDRLENFYSKQNLLEARIRMDRQLRDSVVDLRFDVEPGPRVQFAFEGWQPPGGLRKRIRQIWAKGVFDLQRAKNVEEALREELLARGYLRPEIASEITMRGENTKFVLFEVQPGVRFRDVDTVFPGAEAFKEERLTELLKNESLKNRIFTETDEVQSLLYQFYREHGYLSARVLEPRIETAEETRTGRIVIPIEEGPAFNVADLVFKGIRPSQPANCKSAFLSIEVTGTVPSCANRRSDGSRTCIGRTAIRTWSWNTASTRQRSRER